MYLPDQRQLRYHPLVAQGLLGNPPANRVLSTCFRLRPAHVFARARESRVNQGGQFGAPENKQQNGFDQEEDRRARSTGTRGRDNCSRGVGLAPRYRDVPNEQEQEVRNPDNKIVSSELPG